MENQANPNSAPAGTVIPEQLKRANWRLLAALLLIGLAIGGLALVERWRQRPSFVPPPHEPSQALIASPPATPVETDGSDIPVEPPPPPQVVNNEMLPAPARPAASLPSLRIENAARPPRSAGKSYVVQVGVFMSPANAQVLQQQLVKAGIPAHTETRVQLGPFEDRREAETALEKVRKLGVNAVLVAPR